MGDKTKSESNCLHVLDSHGKKNQYSILDASASFSPAAHNIVAKMIFFFAITI